MHCLTQGPAGPGQANPKRCGADSQSLCGRSWAERGFTGQEQDPLVSLGQGFDGATQAGSLVGTPAIIPPEQAVGQIERVNERADVRKSSAILLMGRS